jgi:hypothetical protein
MKSIKNLSILFMITIVNYSCVLNKKLNSQIYTSQKECLKNSPFNTVGRMYSELEKQKRNKKIYLKYLKELIKENPTDTIILSETYNEICFGCPAYYIEILSKSKLVTYIISDTISKTEIILNDNFKDSNDKVHSALREIKEEIKKNENWNDNPETYGTDQCFDGGHTFYTIIYPNEKMSSMYIRCWIDKESRNDDK